MVPKKYVRHFEYKRRLHDDFLEALLECKEGQNAHKEWKSLAGEVCLGLEGRYVGVADTHMPTKGYKF